MGLAWTGTSRFKVPSKFRWAGKQWSLITPAEESQKWVFLDIILDDEYGLRKINFKPKNILDIGANVGMFSLWAGANFPDSKIHCYEPNKLLRPYLLKNMEQVFATVFMEGVAGEDGFGSFTQSGESMVGQCSLNKSGLIPVVSLRRAIDRIGGEVDLLKLDCEGAEWAIFESPGILDSVKMIRMEYHLTKPGQSVSRLDQILGEMGFSAIRVAQNDGFGIAWFDRL